MDKIRHIGGGMPLKIDDFDLIQNAYSKGFLALIAGLTGGQACILIGLTSEVVGDDITFTEGYYFDGQEIFYVPEATFTLAEEPVPCYLIPNETTTEERHFHDGNDKDCWEYRRKAFSYNVPEPENPVILSAQKTITECLGEQLEIPEAITGPCTGTKYAELRKGIKYVFFSPIVNGYFYFIKEIRYGTGTSPKTYKILINKTNSFLSAGETVGTYNITDSYQYTGLHVCPITSSETGGIAGFVIVNWDEFTYGSTYTCSKWIEGALAMIVTPSTASSGGGGTTTTEVTAETTVRGGESLMLVNMTDPDDILYLADPDEIVGEIVLKNTSANPLEIKNLNYPIDGNDSIILAPQASVTIICTTGHFYVKSGTYSLPPS